MAAWRRRIVIVRDGQGRGQGTANVYFPGVKSEGDEGGIRGVRVHGQGARGSAPHMPIGGKHPELGEASHQNQPKAYYSAVRVSKSSSLAAMERTVEAGRSHECPSVEDGELKLLD